MQILCQKTGCPKFHIKKKREEIDEKNHTEITNDLLHKIRGIYDFKALNERYKNKKIYDLYCPNNETEKKNF